MEKCSLENWESVLKVVASNVQDEDEFALLAGKLSSLSTCAECREIDSELQKIRCLSRCARSAPRKF